MKRFSVWAVIQSFPLNATFMSASRSQSPNEVPVREDANHRLRPETSVYRITLRLAEPAPRWNQAVRGTVLVDGPRISLAQRAWEKGVRILIRESGV